MTFFQRNCFKNRQLSRTWHAPGTEDIFQKPKKMTFVRLRRFSSMLHHRPRLTDGWRREMYSFRTLFSVKIQFLPHHFHVLLFFTKFITDSVALTLFLRDWNLARSSARIFSIFDSVNIFAVIFTPISF